MVTALADAGDMQGAAGLYKTIYPDAAKVLGPNLPPDLDPSMLPHMKQIADAMAPATAKEGFTLGANQTRYGADGKVIATAPAAENLPGSIKELQYLQQHPELAAFQRQQQEAGRAPRQPSDFERRYQMAQQMGATPDQLKQMIMGGSREGAPPTTPGDQSKQGDAYLATLPQQQSAQVKALAEGRMAFPTGTALKSPYWQEMLSAVSQYDPTFDAVNYNARSSTRKAFTSGKEAQTVNALNTVAEHLGTLSDNIQALHNTSFQPYNILKNKVADLTGDPDIARFNTSKKAVADEVAKVWRASGGSEADIQENLKNLSGAQSPEQLNAAVATLTHLIAGKVAALNDQYTQGMGTTKQLKPLVSPEAKRAYDKTLSRAGMAPDDAAMGAKPTQAGAATDSDPLGLLQ